MPALELIKNKCKNESSFVQDAQVARSKCEPY